MGKNRKKLGRAAIGVAAGAVVGSKIGIVAGPLGGIAGTVPCAIVGGVIGWMSADDAPDLVIIEVNPAPSSAG